jgi:hypothetical protein
MKLFGAITIAAILCISATAGTIYDNTGEAIGGRDPVGGSLPSATPFGPIYSSFTTGANASNLTSLSLVLQNCDPVNEPQDCSVAGGSGATVALFADASTNPSLIGSTFLASVSDASLTTTPTTYSISLASNPELDADTRYWIGITENDANTTVSWNWDTTDAGLGVSGEFDSNSGGTISNSLIPGTYEMQVGTTDVVTDTAPEPLSSLLLGSGAVALGLLRRRSKKL